MSASFSSIGSFATVVSGTSLTPGTPPVAWNAGDWLYIFATQYFGSDTLSSIPTGWRDDSPHVLLTKSPYLLSRLATGGDTIPTLTWNTTITGFAVCFVISAGSNSLILDSSADHANSVSTTGVVGPSAITPSVNNCTGIWCGSRNKTNASNGTSFSVGTGWTIPAGGTIVMAGVECAGAVAYQFQTTAASSTTNLSGTVADGSGQTNRSIMAFYQPPSGSVQPYPPMSQGGMGVQMCQ